MASSFLFVVIDSLLYRVLFNAEVEKKNKYARAQLAHLATSLCFSVDGLAGSEANWFLKKG